MNIDKIIQELTDLLKRITNGRCSIALAGAHAKGAADVDSDLDLYMLLDDPKPYEEIRRVISNAADDPGSVYVSYSFDEAPYGGGIDFTYRGIPIEVTVRFFSKVRERVEECLDGRFDIIPQTWTSNGYYTFIYLSELHFIKPVWESDGFIETYKEKIKQYPEKLRKSIITCFLGRAGTWLYNFHYESAIKREDILFTAPIVLHTVLDMIQVIFALNRIYFTGDKKLEAALGAMPYCPRALTDHLAFLLQTSKDGEKLRKQYDILKEIYDDLRAKIAQEQVL